MTRVFEFYTSIKLPEFAMRKAGSVDELLAGIREADDSSIFHHTFHFLYQHQYAIPQPPSDFAYWVSVILLDHGLAERLAAINPLSFPTIAALRERLVGVIESHRKEHGCSTRSPDGMDFFFMRANSLVFRTPHEARDVESFIEAVGNVSIGSIYHHMFEARLARGQETNDFSMWLDCELGMKEAARRIARLDPYFMTLEEMRRRIQAIARGAGEAR